MKGNTLKNEILRKAEHAKQTFLVLGFPTDEAKFPTLSKNLKWAARLPFTRQKLLSGFFSLRVWGTPQFH